MTLPPHLAAALDAIGVRTPPQPTPPPQPVWRPQHLGEQPPF